MTYSIQELADIIQAIGFRCIQCGDCCRGLSSDSNLVLVGPSEIRDIIDATSMEWSEIAAPYPEFLQTDSGCLYTFAWCIRRTADSCIYLENGQCCIYQNRPWICRTYPFMLSGEELLTFPCRGLGAEMTPDEALLCARLLVQRHLVEDEEYEQISARFSEHSLPKGGCVVIDAEGLKSVDG